MPPKEKAGGKKGGKKLQVLAQLNAAQATYKAACRRNGVPMDKQLANSLEEAIQASGTIDKVSLTGPEVGAGSVRAALELMCGYPGVRNLGCWGCSVGSDGLAAIAAFLILTGGKRWQGSRLRLLEVVADGSGTSLEAWPATCMAHMSGKLAVQGAGHEQPCWHLDTATPLVTSTTLRLQEWGMEAPSYHQLDSELENAARVGALVTSLTYRLLDEAHQREAQEAADVAASGHMWATALPPSMLPGDMGRCSRLSSQPRGQICAAPACTDGVTRQPHPAPGNEAQGLMPSVCQGPQHPVTGFPGPKSTQRHPDEFLSRQPAASLAAAPGFLAGHGSTVAARHGHRSMAFSLPSLQALGRALGVVGTGLQILVLDHNQLGDLGMHALAPGLARCSTLKQLSLSGCGLGAVAGQVLAAALTPPLAMGGPPATTDTAATAMQPPQAGGVIAEEEAGEGDSGDAGGGCDVKQVDALSPLPPATLHHQARPVLTPQLLHLNLSRNPLGGAGLTNLCAGLQHCTMLKVLNLHSIGLTEDDVPALETLAAALQATSLDQIDLGANFFGDGGAAALVNSTHTRKLRTTAHGLTRGHGDEGSMLLTSLVRKNLPAKKKAGGKKKKA